jgi:hypothetical protein
MARHRRDGDAFRQRRGIMHTIVLATQKGGTGKSSLAIGLAVAAMQNGHVVRMIETDRQGTVETGGGAAPMPSRPSRPSPAPGTWSGDCTSSTAAASR